MQMYYATSFYSCTSPLKTSHFSLFIATTAEVFSEYPAFPPVLLFGYPVFRSLLTSCVPLLESTPSKRLVEGSLHCLVSQVGSCEVYKCLCQFHRIYLTLLHFVGWFSCYFVPNTPFECYADSSVTPFHTTNNFHSEKNPVYSLRKIILAITYLTIESNFFPTGISNMFVLCRNHYRTDCTRRWLSAL